MFNVGGGEMIVIFLLALIVLGPDKLPNAARQAGKYLSEFRRMSQGFQQELKDAMDIPELNDLKATLTNPTSVFTTPSDATTTSAPSDGSNGTNGSNGANGSHATDRSNGTSGAAADTAATGTSGNGADAAVVRLDPPPQLDEPSTRTSTTSIRSTASIVVEGPSGSFT